MALNSYVRRAVELAIEELNKALEVDGIRAGRHIKKARGLLASISI
ncbi:hypothetical protein HZB89_00880 [archaeon]|nr:hypothetical protein [archaeon]